MIPKAVKIACRIGFKYAPDRWKLAAHLPPRSGLRQSGQRRVEATYAPGPTGFQMKEAYNRMNLRLKNEFAVNRIIAKPQFLWIDFVRDGAPARDRVSEKLESKALLHG